MTNQPNERPEAPAELLRRELRRILDERLVTTVFQPIVDLRYSTILAYEALTRCPEDSLFRGPDQLFDAADSAGMLGELEQVTREQAVREAGCWPTDPLLFLNTSPTVIAVPGFALRFESLVEETPGISPDRVVIEITERVESGSLAGLHQEIIVLRESGFRIALDDVGSGLSGLNRMMAIRPNWVKLDLELVQNVDRDPLQQNLLRSFIRFARLSNMALIAEGIEREAELETLMDMGVVYGQGYHLARPATVPPAVDPEARASIVRINDRAESRSIRGTDTDEAVRLARPVPVIDRDHAWQDLMSEIGGSGPPRAIVMDGHQYAGIVDRSMLERWSLDGRSFGPIGAMPLLQSPLVSATTPLAELLDIAAHHPGTQEVVPLVVEHEGTIAGLITPRELVRTAASAHQRVAASLGILSTLPGRVQADQWLTAHIARGDTAPLAFIDLCDFSVYNLAYGVEMGDTLLQRLVGLMRQVLGPGEHGGYLAHLGEDRFLFQSANMDDALFDQLIDGFEQMLPEFFSATDIAAQAFAYTGGSRPAEPCPLTSVRVLVLDAPCAKFASSREIHLHVQQMHRVRHDEERKEFRDGQRRTQRVISERKAG